MVRGVSAVLTPLLIARLAGRDTAVTRTPASGTALLVFIGSLGALGVLVLVWRHWLPLLGAVGFGIATLTAFLISTTPSGFFEVHERWVGVPVWLSAISEVGAIVFGVAALVA